jgi:hypothetical protein
MIPTKYQDIYINDVDVYKKQKNGTLHKLSKWVDNLGYYMVSFRISGKRKYVRVHRLIAETLIPNPLNLPMVNHKDTNKLNNKLTNLEWCTNAHNTQEAYDRNLYRSKCRCGVRAIHKESNEKFEFTSVRECAKELRLNRKTITSILKGEKKTNNYDYYFEYI